MACNAGFSALNAGTFGDALGYDHCHWSYLRLRGKRIPARSAVYAVTLEILKGNL